jgi:hypothetical protein
MKRKSTMLRNCKNITNEELLELIRGGKLPESKDQDP